MMKAIYPTFALLALLLAAMAGGWHIAPTVASVYGQVTSHDPTSIDDDDDDDDDQDVSSMLAAPAAHDDDDHDDVDADGDGDAIALPPLVVAARFPSFGEAGSLSLTRRGLRPSGEHRASAERPPRI